MQNLIDKAKNGAMAIGKFRDTCFYSVDENGCKELSPWKFLCWAVILDILAHLMPIFMLIALALLVAIDFGGNRQRQDSQTPKEKDDNAVIDGKAIPV